ncbi:hypothetical protein [Actinoplanes sp. NPDC051859]|uniref:hypothetical protein n=1 Tax=Actinoplanes sp. NPDC051859 TaxID=3363909 RepID=UPI0037BD3207
MIIQRMTLAATAVAALTVAGCANGGTTTDVPVGAPAASAPGAPSATPPSAAPSSAAPSPGAPSAKPPVQKGSRTITGTITAGVEPNCLLIDDNLLIFDQESVRNTAKVGTKVTVTGRSEPGMMSTCQQGTPFMVTAIRAN